jgi:hypothetical protein
MKSLNCFIVKPLNDKRYDDTRDYGGTELIISTDLEDAKRSNRLAEVIEVPLNYKGEIESGDTIVVHHNIFKFYNNMSGTLTNSASYIKEGLYIVDADKFFMYRKKGSTEWKAWDRFCFVKPIPQKNHIFDKGATEEPLMGKMFVPNDFLKQMGIKVGDEVCYTPEMNYEFEIEGQKLYRIFDHQITIKL